MKINMALEGFLLSLLKMQIFSFRNILAHGQMLLVMSLSQASEEVTFFRGKLMEQEGSPLHGRPQHPPQAQPVPSSWHLLQITTRNLPFPLSRKKYSIKQKKGKCKRAFQTQPPSP